MTFDANARQKVPKELAKNFGRLIDVVHHGGQREITRSREARRSAVALAEAERQLRGGCARGSGRELELGGVAVEGGAKGGGGGGGGVGDGEEVAEGGGAGGGGAVGYGEEGEGDEAGRGTGLVSLPASPPSATSPSPQLPSHLQHTAFCHLLSISDCPSTSSTITFCHLLSISTCPATSSTSFRPSIYKWTRTINSTFSPHRKAYRGGNSENRQAPAMRQ